MIDIPDLLLPFVRKLIDGKDREAWLFPDTDGRGKSGKHWRDWPRLNVQRICDLFGVSVITAHGMRGTMASLARSNGTAAHVVAATLGHSSTRMQDQAYVRADAAHAGKQGAALLRLVK